MALGNLLSGERAHARRRAKYLAAGIYQDAGVTYPCDPLDLAEALGLQVRPANVGTAEISNGILRFPNRASLPARGLQVFSVLAKHIAEQRGEGDLPELMRELALPEPLARHCAIPELAELQPHFPLALLLEIILVAREISSVVAKKR